MRIKTVRTIFRKEMKDTLRDRRTLIFMLAVPILAIPLLMTVMTRLTVSQVTKEMKEISVVAVQGLDFLPDDLRTRLIEAEGLSLQSEADIAGKDFDALVEDVREGNLDAVVNVPMGFESALETWASTQIEIYYDEAEIKSEFTLEKLEDIFADFREEVIQARLEQRDIPADVIKPFETQPQNVASAQKLAGQKLGPLLPYVVILMCFLGAIYPAIDLAAGEKERGTLETLLVSPASRGEFVVGKYLVILTTAVISAFLAMGSLTYSLNNMVGDMVEDMTEALAIQFDLTTVVLVLMIVLPMAAIFAAVLLSVSVFARSFKEAQSYITVMNMAIIFPAFVSFVPGIEVSYKTAVIPIVNVSLIIRDAISGSIEWNFIITAFLSTVALAALALMFAKRWFERESVLFRM